MNFLNRDILVEVIGLGLKYGNGADQWARVVLNDVVPGELVFLAPAMIDARQRLIPIGGSGYLLATG